jgi:hypothetical protein
MSVTPLRINTKSMKIIRSNVENNEDTPVSSVINAVVRGEFNSSSLFTNVTKRGRKKKVNEELATVQQISNELPQHTNAFVRPVQRLKSVAIEEMNESSDIDSEDASSDEFSSDTDSTRPNNSDLETSNDDSSDSDDQSLDNLKDQLKTLEVSDGQVSYLIFYLITNK